MTKGRIARNGRGVNRLLQEARLRDLLYNETEIARVQGRIDGLVTPGCAAWLEQQVERETLGLFPEQRLARWEALERELENEDTWAWYEARAAKANNGGLAAEADAPVCVMEVTG